MLCNTCKHGVFCPIWGEYKCVAQGKTIYNASNLLICDDYIKDAKKLKDDYEAKPCGCETCAGEVCGVE